MKLGPYNIVRPLASGGQAEVLLGELSGPGGFRVRHALKQLRQPLTQDELSTPPARALIAEARLLERLTSPHTLAVHGLYHWDGRLVMVVEYVAGASLASVLARCAERREAVPPALALWVARCVLLALQQAHELHDELGRPLHVIHRDVNPQNILLGFDGRCKLIDFGIAISKLASRDTRLGFVKGKLEYLSPEQAYASDDMDHRTDLYSLGVTLYEMLTGQNPLALGEPSRVLSAARDPRFVPATQLRPRLPASLDGLLARALARDPEERYPTARAMMLDCVRLLYELEPLWCGDELAPFVQGALRREQAAAAQESRARQGTQVLPAAPPASAGGSSLLSLSAAVLAIPRPSAVAPPPSPAPWVAPPLAAPVEDEGDPEEGLATLSEARPLPTPRERTVVASVEEIHGFAPTDPTREPPSQDEELDLSTLLQAIEDIYDRRSGRPEGREDHTRVFQRERG